MKIKKVSGYSVPITGRLLFTWSVQSQLVNVDQFVVSALHPVASLSVGPIRPVPQKVNIIADENVLLKVEILSGITGQYKGCTL